MNRSSKVDRQKTLAQVRKEEQQKERIIQSIKIVFGISIISGLIYFGNQLKENRAAESDQLIEYKRKSYHISDKIEKSYGGSIDIEPPEIVAQQINAIELELDKIRFEKNSDDYKLTKMHINEVRHELGNKYPRHYQVIRRLEKAKKYIYSFRPTFSPNARAGMADVYLEFKCSKDELNVVAQAVVDALDQKYNSPDRIMVAIFQKHRTWELPIAVIHRDPGEAWTLKFYQKQYDEWQ